MSDEFVERHRVVDSGEIRLLPDHPSEHAIPADHLAKVVSGLQAALYAIGAQRTCPDSVHPGKNKDIRDRFLLVVQTPQPGSVLLPVQVRDVRDTTSLADELEPHNVLSDATMLLSSVASRDFDSVRALLPSQVLRRHALKDIQRTLPRHDEQWSWELGAAGATAKVASSFADTIEGWLASRDDTEHMAVIGQLIRFDFEARLITLKYPSTGRKLSVVYDTAREDDLLQQRLQLIQVEGDILLDAHGLPAEIVHVDRTHPIDLSPFTIGPVRLEATSLQSKRPLEFTPHLDRETSQLYEVSDDVLGIDVSAHTRNELVSALQDEIRFLWTAYALEDPARLSASAQELQRVLLDEFSEVG